MINPYIDLKKFTQARLFQSFNGHAVATNEILKFNFDHANARDAIHFPWNSRGLEKFLENHKISYQWCKSAATSREEYLKRPDKGRKLDPVSKSDLRKTNKDVSIIVTNGLSSLAIENHAQGMLEALLTELQNMHLSLAPITLVENGRVGISDEIGQQQNSRISIILVGERPGLSSPDSMGIYMTYNPKVGKTDANRKCLSNIRPPEGMSYLLATKKIKFLISESLKRKLSGVELKDEYVDSVVN